MPTAHKIQCPAKVNLFLEVTGRRADGYHTLATVLAKINLFDALELGPADRGPIELELDPESAVQAPAGPDNLVVRAAEAFRKAFKIRWGVRVKLKKNIPMGAGLGGGSSDAAGTLLGLCRVFEVPERGAMPTLRRLARGLGADVPFFLGASPVAIGRGIGERLSPLKTPKALPWMVLVHPGSAIATAGVYKALQKPSRPDVLTRLSQLATLQKKLGAGRPISDWEGLLFNRLEAVVLPAHQEVEQAKRLLARLGAKGVLMSGSGSSVFGFAPSYEEAEAMRQRLQAYPWRVFVTCCLV